MARATLDPRTMADWQIAEVAEESMIPVARLASEFGLREDELIPMVDLWPRWTQPGP